MKKTRNLFILVGALENVAHALAELQFKGAVVVTDPISYTSADEIFMSNKSIICSAELAGSQYLHDSPVYVEVVSGPNHTFQNYINVRTGNISAQFQDIATRLDLDIGDHKSNSSGLNGSPTADSCRYCKVFRGEKDDTILYKSNYFYVLATVGEFVPGYLLIIPKMHVMSIAELPEIQRGELLSVIVDVKHILNLAYGYHNFLVWENGSGSCGIGKAKDSIVHSHLHIAPSNLDIEDIKKISRLDFREIKYPDIPSYKDNSYLLIANDLCDTWFINDDPNVYIPRQFIRQILAEEHNIHGEAWNWRLFPFYDLMHKTENDFLNAVRNNWNSFPSRVKVNTRSYLRTD